MSFEQAHVRQEKNIMAYVRKCYHYYLNLNLNLKIKIKSINIKNKFSSITASLALPKSFHIKGAKTFMNNRIKQGYNNKK